MRRISRIVIVLGLLVGRSPEAVLSGGLAAGMGSRTASQCTGAGTASGIDGGGIEPQGGQIRSIALGT